MSNLLDQVLSTEAKARSLEDKDISNIRGFISKVGDIESNNRPDRYQDDSDESAGRGKFQFENDKGSNASKTAAKRLSQWEEKNGKLPLSKAERDELSKPSPNFAKLSEDTQDAMFIINMSIAENVPFTKIAKGEIPQKEAWIKYHWAGSEEEAENKRKMWDERQAINQAMQARTFVSSLN